MVLFYEFGTPKIEAVPEPKLHCCSVVSSRNRTSSSRLHWSIALDSLRLMSAIPILLNGCREDLGAYDLAVLLFQNVTSVLADRTQLSGPGLHMHLQTDTIRGSHYFIKTMEGLTRTCVGCQSIPEAFTRVLILNYNFLFLNHENRRSCYVCIYPLGRCSLPHQERRFPCSDQFAPWDCCPSGTCLVAENLVAQSRSGAAETIISAT